MAKPSPAPKAYLFNESGCNGFSQCGYFLAHLDLDQLRSPVGGENESERQKANHSH
uniref:Uncharacterized protein n=1 Tax=Rhizophora mucronata TaxID=61149 RepID=A0A2P2P844_RHIMU